MEITVTEANNKNNWRKIVMAEEKKVEAPVKVEEQQAEAPKTAASKTPAKKAVAKKATVKKTVVAKTPTKKVAAKKTVAKKATAKKPGRKPAKKLGKIIFEFDGQQIDFKAIEKKAAKLGGDVYVVAGEKKIYDKDGKAVDLF